MKTLQESLFDKDLVEKDVPGHQLVDLVFYDGEEVRRLNNKVSGNINAVKAGMPSAVHGLGAINWTKVRRDLKKNKGENIDLGLYAYWNNDQYRVRTNETIKKTEMFARLIMCLPYHEECRFGAFNSRWRDEFEELLSEYIVDKSPTGAPGKESYKLQVETSNVGVDIVLYSIGYECVELVRWSFLKL